MDNHIVENAIWVEAFLRNQNIEERILDLANSTSNDEIVANLDLL